MAKTPYARQDILQISTRAVAGGQGLRAIDQPEVDQKATAIYA